MADKPMFPQNAQEILDQYRTKGLGHRMGFGESPALLVIDMIVGFTDLRSPLAASLESQIDVTRVLLDRARTSGFPVIFSTVSYNSVAEAGFFIRKVPSLNYLMAGSPWVEIDPRLGRKDEEYLVIKKFASCFFGTELSLHLHSQGVDTLLITGCTTSGCVRATAVDGLQHGFRPIVVLEGVGDRADQPHVANLLDIDAKYGDVVELQTVLEYLERLPSDAALPTSSNGENTT